MYFAQEDAAVTGFGQRLVEHLLVTARPPRTTQVVTPHLQHGVFAHLQLAQVVSRRDGKCRQVDRQPRRVGIL